MHPDGFPVPQERDFYWKAAALSFTIPTTVDTPQPLGVGILNSATDLKIDYPYGIT
jgi:hypothetical protein